MAESITESGQRAFTWTGPYGGGKSCAALLVGSLVAGTPEQRQVASEVVDAEFADAFRLAFPEDDNRWRILALTGRRADLHQELTRVAAETLNWKKNEAQNAAEDSNYLISQLEAEAGKCGGLLIIVDELGKFFEHATSSGGDVHILQDLAERAARSRANLVVVGILHQSFEQYAGRLGKTARDEWAKVQGRYQNVPFTAQSDEIAALVSRAVIADNVPAEAATLARETAVAISVRRPVDVEGMTAILTGAWPLHPVTSLLLGPVSRQRFAQNERSVFGFLSSSEPHGFQAHLISAPAKGADAWFGPDKLWDYLLASFGSALAVGPDGSRLTLAMEAVERAALRGPLCARLTKAAAMIEFFRNGTGLAVVDDVLRLCAIGETSAAVNEALKELVERAILIRQPRLGGYAIFAGSDFDLDDAIRSHTDRASVEALIDLPARLDVGPIAAKRHYFATGALRTLDVVLQHAQDVPIDPSHWAKSAAERLARRRRKSTGLIVLLTPDPTSVDAPIEEMAAALSDALELAGLTAAVALVSNADGLRANVDDLFALDRIEAAHPHLEGDRIARREVSARRSQIVDLTRADLIASLSSARWWMLGTRAEKLDGANVNVVASAVMDAAYPDSPIIRSELLNRDKPSTSAMAGLRALAHAMVGKATYEALDIKGFPAEKGLYLTVLGPSGLHREGADGIWGFADPSDTAEGKRLKPAWAIFENGRRFKLSELYDKWSSRPIGMKRGVMPVFALAFLLAHRDTVAVYVNGAYEAVIDDVFVDRMMQNPSSVELRRVVRSKKNEAFMMRLAMLLSSNSQKISAAPLPVASALYQRFKKLPLWTQRTTSLSAKAQRVRDIVLKANDPEALLFTDLTHALKEEVDPAVAVTSALLESEAAYPKMLADLTTRLARELGVDPETFAGLGPRAATASGVRADLRLDAFAVRAGAFAGGNGDIEGLASLLVHKPPRSWSDKEQEQAVFELAKLARRFREAEAFAAVKGRAPTASAISVVVGLDPEAAPVFHTFEVTNTELEDAEELASELIGRIRKSNLGATVELAALARVVERLSAEEKTEAS
ncbi:putative ATP-binding protein [Pseudorhizobium banfieldiae]|uniref:Putative ATP-binding protein n=2 Tax=Pseudorhizobium banfieldiae TaxID=1125847 RepID=L0NCN5_9HYPH|nr:putative ATP-binding protein [Pseudorhizobium banfieldiae]